MAGQATIVSAGSVTIASTGAQSGHALTQATLLVNNAAAFGNFNENDPTSSSTAIAAPAPTGQGAGYALNEGYTGTLDLPSGYGVAVIGGNTQVTVTAADATTAIVSAGQLDYTGTADSLTSLGDNSVLNDTSDLASLAVGGSNLAVTLGGAGQTLSIDPGASGTFTEAGTGAHISVAPTLPGTDGSGTSTTAGGISVFQLTADTSVSLNEAGSSSVVVLNSGANTVSAAAGSSTVYATTGNDLYFGGAAQTFFVGASGTTVAVSTVFGGAGNDTVFAQAGVDYTAGSGNSEFVGGSYAQLNGAAPSVVAHSTVTATTGHDLFYGGTVGDQYNLGNASETFVAGGGADTLFGGSVAPTVFGGSNETLKLVGTNAGLVVADGADDVIDASKANQGSTFFINNLPSVGNTTLIGSTGAASLGGAHDTFVVGHATGTVTGAAHTVTIENFHTGDAFFLAGYTAADGAAFESAVANSEAANAKAGAPAGSGSLSFTLSDKTTVTFTNTHPTAAFNGGTVGL